MHPLLAFALTAKLSVTVAEAQDGQLVAVSAERAKVLFSGAGCRCRAPVAARLAFPSAQSGLPDRNVELWIGSDCATQDATRAQRCAQVGAVSLASLATGLPAAVALTADQVMFPTAAGACSETAGTSTLFALLDEDGDGKVDDTWTSAPVAYDAQPPPAAGAPNTTGSEDAIRVAWTVPSATADLAGYQVLCARSDGTPVFAAPRAAPAYRVVSDFASCAAPSTVPSAGAGFAALDPRFVCSDRIAPAATGTAVPLADVTGEVTTTVVTVDAAGNPTPAAAGRAAAILVRDGWEVYRDAGGAADGGYCFVATAAYGDYDHPYVRVLRRFRDGTLAATAAGRAVIRWYYRHSPAWAAFIRRHPVARGLAAAALFPVVALAWLWETRLLALVVAAAALAGLVRRRRHVRPWLPLLLFPALAHADTWGVALGAGPYHPDVDAELPDTRPFATTFGDGPDLYLHARLERHVALPLGQLSVAGGVGWMSATALAFVQDPTTGQATATRSADETTFALVPLSLTLLYQLTAVADRTTIPIVPYGGLGLTYDLWWFTRADGNVSTTGNDRGQGGTLGWQAIAGLALRLDALDRDAARALLRDSGVRHVSLFVELDHAVVDGLLEEHRLHVGDTTFTAGLRFDL